MKSYPVKNHIGLAFSEILWYKQIDRQASCYFIVYDIVKIFGSLRAGCNKNLTVEGIWLGLHNQVTSALYGSLLSDLSSYNLEIKQGQWIRSISSTYSKNKLNLLSSFIN